MSSVEPIYLFNKCKKKKTHTRLHHWNTRSQLDAESEILICTHTHERTPLTRLTGNKTKRRLRTRYQLPECRLRLAAPNTVCTRTRSEGDVRLVLCIRGARSRSLSTPLVRSTPHVCRNHDRLAHTHTYTNPYNIRHTAHTRTRTHNRLLATNVGVLRMRGPWYVVLLARPPTPVVSRSAHGVTRRPIGRHAAGRVLIEGGREDRRLTQQSRSHTHHTCNTTHTRTYAYALTHTCDVGRTHTYTLCIYLHMRAALSRSLGSPSVAGFIQKIIYFPLRCRRG